MFPRILDNWDFPDEIAYLFRNPRQDRPADL